MVMFNMIFCITCVYLYSAYGTACGLTLLVISAVGGVAGVGVYFRCKRKGKEIALVLCCKHNTFSNRKNKEHTN